MILKIIVVAGVLSFFVGYWHRFCFFSCPVESRFQRALLDFYYRAKAIWYGCARFFPFISMFRLCKLNVFEPMERVNELSIDTKCILKQKTRKKNRYFYGKIACLSAYSIDWRESIAIGTQTTTK